MSSDKCCFVWSDWNDIYKRKERWGLTLKTRAAGQRMTTTEIKNMIKKISENDVSPYCLCECRAEKSI